LSVSPSESGVRVSGASPEALRVPRGVVRRRDLGIVRRDQRRVEIQAKILRIILVEFEHLRVEHDELLRDVELIDQLLRDLHARGAAGDDQLIRVRRDGDAQIGRRLRERRGHGRGDVRRARRRRAVDARQRRAQRVHFEGLVADADRIGGKARLHDRKRRRASTGIRVELIDRVGDATLLGCVAVHGHRVEPFVDAQRDVRKGALDQIADRTRIVELNAIQLRVPHVRSGLVETDGEVFRAAHAVGIAREYETAAGDGDAHAVHGVRDLARHRMRRRLRDANGVAAFGHASGGCRGRRCRVERGDERVDLLRVVRRRADDHGCAARSGCDARRRKERAHLRNDRRRAHDVERERFRARCERALHVEPGEDGSHRRDVVRPGDDDDGVRVRIDGHAIVRVEFPENACGTLGRNLSERDHRRLDAR